MKKIILLLCIVLLIFIACMSTGFGAVAPPILEPNYIATQMHVESFYGGTGSILTPEVFLEPMGETALDRVVINIRIEKISNSTEYYNRTFTTYYDAIKNRFYVKDSFNAPLPGVYLMSTTYSCYKNNRLVETIEGTPRSASY